jgi:hypothetical protein
MLESTGLIENGLARTIQPLHDALLALLVRHLGLDAVDDELQRVAICIEGLGVQLHVGLDINETIAPGVNTGPGAIDHWHGTLLRAALAMVEGEARRRGRPLPDAPPGSPL